MSIFSIKKFSESPCRIESVSNKCVRKSVHFFTVNFKLNLKKNRKKKLK